MPSDDNRRKAQGRRTASIDTVAENALAGKYGDVADCLHAILVHHSTTDKTLPRHVLSAAYSLVQACAQCHAEADRHKEISRQAAEQEQQLQRQLLTLLDTSDRPGIARYLTAAGWTQLQPAENADGLPSHDCFAALEKHGPQQSSSACTTGEAPLPACRRHTMDIYCLGPFRLFLNDQLLDHWPNGKSKSLFKYLVTHRRHPVCKDVLMDTFWPGVRGDCARNNLNVAIHTLRKALSSIQPDYSFVQFVDGCYVLNPEVEYWMDAEDFTTHCTNAHRLDAQGIRASAAEEFRAAAALYQGEFLADDRYEDWIAQPRQAFQDDYNKSLDYLGRYAFEREDYEVCIDAGKRLLSIEPCNEHAHRQLMRCYEKIRQTHLAVRQYHLCVAALRRELDLSPSLETVTLFQHIRCHHVEPIAKLT